jgi:parallel beta-helix repeat protein
LEPFTNRDYINAITGGVDVKRVKSIIILLLVLSLVLVSLGGKVQIINGKDSLAPATIQDEHFIVQKVLYVFHGYELLCSFNAKSGYWVELNILSTGDYPYEVILGITSANHGLIFNARAYGSVEVSNFTQIVNLNYDDSYNITVAKHPFYSTVKISGTIDLYHNETTNLTPSLYIRADGTIEGTDKIHRDGDVYTFTDSIINQSIVVERNNTVLDGANFTLQGILNEVLIDIRHIKNVTIKNIQIIGSGIQLLGANNNTIFRNLITGGISFLGSNYNIIVGNTFLGNVWGIYLHQSYNNSFYDNSFINNTEHVHDNIWDQPYYPWLLSINFWDNGTTGNYWSSYNGTDNNGDGIGDTPYVIDQNNQDNYPLMEPVAVIPEFPSWAPMLLTLIALTVILAVYRKRLPKTPNN